MSARWMALLVALALSAAAPPAAGRAQALRPMTLVDVREVPTVIDPQLSPDGRAVIYQLSRVDWKSNRRPSHIWKQDVAGGAPVQLTSGESGESSPRWSPDGRTISFMRDGQIYLQPAAGGDARALTKHATNVSAAAWAPGGASMYFIAPEAKTSDERAREQSRDDVYAYDEGVKQRHLWIVDVETGAERAITSGDFSVLQYRVSRDGTRIAMHRSPTPAYDTLRDEVWVTDANGEHAFEVTHNGVDETDAELSPDNTQILFIAEASGAFAPYYSSHIFVVPATGGPPRQLVPSLPYWLDRATWSADGKSILAVANMGVHSEIFQIDVASGTARQLTDGRHSIPTAPAPAWNFVPSLGRLVFLFDEPTRFGDIWTLDLAPGAAPARVTSVYDSLARTFRLPRQEKVQWKSGDATIEGLLFYPLDYQPGTRYPLVVQLHGGPQDSDRFGFWGWNDYVQVLTAKGYAVLKPNYRGSAGYGDTFYRDTVGGFFHHAHLDILAGVDALVAAGIADPERLAVMGFSAGAHLTNKLVTVTDRFRAASAYAGAANWISLFAQTDLRGNRTSWFGGTPWQKHAPIDLFWNQSPLKDAVKVTTPTLFVVGENDGRVPLAQSLEMFRALKANGVPTKLYVAPREGHGWLEPRHQLFKANAELAWFEQYVTRRPYVWEQAPGDAATDKATASAARP